MGCWAMVSGSGALTATGAASGSGLGAGFGSGTDAAACSFPSDHIGADSVFGVAISSPFWVLASAAGTPLPGGAACSELP